MPHLAAGAGLALAVEVEVRRRGRRGSRASRPTSSPIRLRISTRGATRSVAPSGRPQIARMWFSNCEVERALDRPVAAIVDARRHLVEHRPVRGARRTPGSARRHSRARRRPARRAPRPRRPGAGDPGRPARSSGAGCRLRARCAARPRRRVSPSAPRQSRIENSASKATKPSRIDGAPPIAAQAASASRRCLDPRLALAVIAEAPRLEDRRRADRGERGVEPGAVVDRREGAGRPPRPCDEALLAEPVLRDLQRARSADGAARARRSRRAARSGYSRTRR